MFRTSTNLEFQNRHPKTLSTFGVFQSTGSSGGRGGGGLGGRGGGIFFLNISDTLDIEGTLSANGDKYAGSYAGGGSGGSILIRTNLFEGSGTVQVRLTTTTTTTMNF